MSQGAALIQKALTGASAPLSKQPATATARVRLQMEVLPTAVALAQGQVRLAPGHTFTVRVLIQPAEPEDVSARVVSEPMSLSVRWEGPSGVTVEPEPARLLPELLGSPTHRDLRLETAAEAGELQGRLVLSLTGLRGAADVQRLEVRVGAPEEEADAQLQELLDQCHVNLETAPARAATTAILRIEAAEKKFRLHGFHVKARDLEDEIPDPGKSLVDFGRKEQDTERILAEVRRFSRKTTARLHQWVKALVAAGPEVVLIIQDHGETRIPWEMVELGGTPLGAQLPVVRWLMAQDAAAEAVMLRTERREWVGRVASYVDAEALAESRREFAALKDCLHEACATLKAFQTALYQPAQPLALLFVASHGVVAKDDEHAGAFGSLDEEQLQITSLDLELLNPFQGERPLAFINACHSARLWSDVYGPTGLPEVFLAKFAGAYLGTLGAVDDEEAASIGERILVSARTQEGVCIPALLRTLRKEAFAQLQPTNGPSRSRYVNTFLYVFYGSPESWLRLEPAGGAGG